VLDLSDCKLSENGENQEHRGEPLHYGILWDEYWGYTLILSPERKVTTIRDMRGAHLLISKDGKTWCGIEDSMLP